MDVEFIRTGERRYAVEVRPPGRPVMRAEPAPAYHHEVPHDLLHLECEVHWGLRDGVFGSVAQGGDAGSFREPGKPRDKRTAKRDAHLGGDTARSEGLAGAMLIAWVRRQRGTTPLIDPGSADALRVTESEVEAFLERIAPVATEWAALPVGGSLQRTWPGAAGRSR